MSWISRTTSLLLLAAAVVWAQTETGSMSGVVRDAATGAPVEGAILYLDNNALPLSTDAHGRYSIPNLPAGPYLLQASHIDGPHEAVNIAVNANQDVHMELRLARHASLAGTVLDPEGKPVKGATVAMLIKSYTALSGDVVYGRNSSATSDANGAYRFEETNAGVPFLLRATSPNPTAPTNDSHPLGDGALALIDAYYPKATTTEAAEEITLLPGESRTRVDIRLLEAPAFCASGRATGAQREVQVLVSRAGSQSPFQAFAAPPAGDFRVCGLPAGSYRFHFLALPPKPGNPRLGADELVTIDKSDRAGLDVRLKDERNLHYVIEVAKNQPQVAACTTTINIQFLAPFHANSESSFDSSDLMVGPEPFNDYRVAFDPQSQCAYLKDIVADGQSVMNRAIHPPLSDLHIILGFDGATVTATAVDSKDRPQPEAQIALASASAATESEFAASLIFGAAAQDGTWKPNALAPGRYVAIAAYAPLSFRAYWIDRLWAARNLATEIDAAPNAKLQVKIPVQDLSSQ